MDGTPRLFQTDPSGTFSAWKANCTGRSSKTVKEFLEKHYVEDMSTEEAIKLAVRSLMEVVESGSKNIEVAVMKPFVGLSQLEEADVEELVKVIEKEKAEEEEKKKKKGSEEPKQ